MRWVYVSVQAVFLVGRMVWGPPNSTHSAPTAGQQEHKLFNLREYVQDQLNSRLTLSYTKVLLRT